MAFQISAEDRSITLKIPYKTPEANMDPCRVPVWPQGLLESLKKFSSIEEVKMEFCLVDPQPRTFLRWRSTSGGFIIMYAGNPTPTVQTTTLEENITLEEEREFCHVKDRCISDSKFRAQYMKELLEIFKNIKKIAGVDSANQGTILLEEDGIANLKTKIPCVTPHVDMEDLTKNNGYNKTWVAAKLHISDGIIIKRVVLHLVNTAEVDDAFMVETLFQEREYSEAALKMIDGKPILRGGNRDKGRNLRAKFYFVEF